MKTVKLVISGLGVVTSGAVGKEEFWGNLRAGRNCVKPIRNFSVGKIKAKTAGEVDDSKLMFFFGDEKGLRNLDRSALFLIAASKMAIDDAKLSITGENTDDIGMVTGTSFSHLVPIVQFDRQVLKEGLNFSNPALFPSTVINAASSQVSIKFNMQGFNTTVSTGYTSSLDAIKYAENTIETGRAKTVLCGAVDTLSYPVLFGFNKLGYLAGLKGKEVMCPYDKRRNGPVLGEGAGVVVMEDEKTALARKAKVYARVRAVANYFDARGIARIHPQGLGLEKAVRSALEQADVLPEDIDYISTCANSSREMDGIEVLVLKKIFGESLKTIPASSIKSMLGETFSASGILQIISSAGAMHKGFIPPTINYKQKDPDCDIDCVPNRARKKRIKTVLVTSFGPGGYNSACILEKV